MPHHFKLKTVHVNELSLVKKYGNSAHPVYLNTFHKEENKIDKNKKRVYVKYIDNRIETDEECTFSALYKMDIGVHAARTLPLVDENELVIGIASMELPGLIEYHKLRNLHQDKKLKAIKERLELKGLEQIDELLQLRGLASVLMSSWLYGEDDLHRNNFGLFYDTPLKNKNTHVCWGRIDFGMSFSEITHGKRPFREAHQSFTAITLEDLENFPVLKGSKNFYWPTRIDLYSSTLNLKGKGKGNAYDEKDKELFTSLKENPHFIKEKNEFLLRLFLIPIEAKKSLIKTNISDQEVAERIANNLENRIHNLRWTALADKRFCQYFREVIQHYEQTEKRNRHKTDFYKIISSTLNNLNSVLNDNPLKKEDLLNEIHPFIDSIKYLGTKPKAGNSWNNYLIDYEDTLSTLMNDDLMPSKEKNYKIHQEHKKLLNAALFFQKKDGKKHHLQEALNKIQLTKAQKTTLYSLDHIERTIESINPSPYDNMAVLKKNILDLKKNWLVPWLSKNQVSNDDLLFQQEITSRLRTIDHYLSAFNKSNKGVDKKIITSLNNTLGASPKRSQNEWTNKDTETLKNTLLLLEKELSISNIDTHLQSMRRHLEKLPKEFSIIHTIYFDQEKTPNVTHSLLSCLDKHLKQGGDSIRFTKNNILAKSYFNIATIINNFFDEPFMHSLDQETLISGKSPLKSLLKQASEDLDKLMEKKHTSEDVIYQVEFIMARLAFNCQTKLLIQKYKSNKYPEKEKKQYLNLIKTGKVLSDALSDHKYNTSTSFKILIDISQSAILGAQMMQKPTREHALACLNHAQYLIDHQNYLALAIAVATALICIGISLLVTAHLIVPAIGIALVCGTGVLAYTGWRFFNNRAKIIQNLRDFQTQTEEEENQIGLHSLSLNL